MMNRSFDVNGLSKFSIVLDFDGEITIQDGEPCSDGVREVKKVQGFEDAVKRDSVEALNKVNVEQESVYFLIFAHLL